MKTEAIDQNLMKLLAEETKQRQEQLYTKVKHQRIQMLENDKKRKEHEQKKFEVSNYFLCVQALLAMKSDHELENRNKQREYYAVMA